METTGISDIQIVNTTIDDLSKVLWLFEQAMELEGKNGYKVWKSIDRTALEKDIQNKLQYKIIKGTDIQCIFSVLYTDPFIWGKLDQQDAIYLHRIVVNPNYKGQKLFEKVLEWAMQSARQRRLKYIRMDTWADNFKIISYYQTYGFTFIGNYKTPDAPELPVPNRNINVALLQMQVEQ
jgi:ribosomal protein S18 acetylase RimI-like enzyme